MIMRFSILFVLIAITFCSFAQNQNNQWRFGFGSAIDFNTTPPSYPTGCALPSIQLPLITGSLIEGTASIADKNTGELMFYTDGITVWNKLNQTMPNGSDLGGSDFLSSYMAAVIIPMPSSCDKYYIFCIDDFEEGSDGITYSVVDMSLDNGLGDVVAGQKQISLYDNENTELLLAYPKSSGDGYWLLSNGSDFINPTLAAFEITSQGVSNVPVLSPINIYASGRLNYQGTKFVCTGEYDEASANFLGFQMYDFNAATGQISNPVNIPFNIPDGDVLQYFEFTFDGNILYAAGNFSIYQFDLNSGNPTTIAASAELIPFSNIVDPHAALQHGPDGNLYHVLGNRVYRIENPTSLSPGPIIELPADLSPFYCLPQWIFLLPENSQSVITQTGDSCFQTNQLFSLNSTTSVNSIQWDFGDPSSGISNTSSQLSPQHTFSSSGDFTITAIVDNTCAIDTVELELFLVDCQNTDSTENSFEFPNVITPNNDGINDLFEIDNLPENTEVIILNRWGNIVFSSTNYQNNWDGKDKSGEDLVDGVYTYKFKTQSGQIRHGFVTLLR
jgi:gliding motility-associated-like protein